MIDENSNLNKKIEYIIKTPKKSVIPRSEKQKEYVSALKNSDIIISEKDQILPELINSELFI